MKHQKNPWETSSLNYQIYHGYKVAPGNRNGSFSHSRMLEHGFRSKFMAANLHLYLSEMTISKDYLLTITHWSKQNNPSGDFISSWITSRLWIWKHPAAKSIKIPLFADVSPSFFSNTNKSLMLPFPGILRTPRPLTWQLLVSNLPGSDFSES